MLQILGCNREKLVGMKGKSLTRQKRRWKEKREKRKKEGKKEERRENFRRNVNEVEIE